MPHPFWPSSVVSLVVWYVKSCQNHLQTCLPTLHCTWYVSNHVWATLQSCVIIRLQCHQSFLFYSTVMCLRRWQCSSLGHSSQSFGTWGLCSLCLLSILYCIVFSTIHLLLVYCILHNFTIEIPSYACIGSGTRGAVGAVAPTKYKAWGHIPHDCPQSWQWRTDNNGNCSVALGQKWPQKSI